MQSYIITGYTGVGKTTLVNSLDLDNKWKIISAGKTFTKFALKHNVKNSRKSIQNFAINYFNEHGYKVFTYQLLNQTLKHNKVIFVGIRPLEVVMEIKKTMPNTKIIFINSNKETRKARLIKRQHLSLEEVYQLQHHQIEINMDNIKNIADYIINNDTTINEAKAKIEKILLNSNI